MSLSLKVNGTDYGGWHDIDVDLGMDRISGSFDLGVSERWPGQMSARKIVPEDACTISMEGETVITGYVDDSHPSYGDRMHRVRITGRDKAGQLVDCSVTGGQWNNQTLTQLAESVCKPFGIKVIAQTDVGAAFPTFAAQHGETVFEFLQRAAAQRGVLLMSDGLGNLIIGRSSRKRLATALVRGENILSARAHLSMRYRYSAITVKGSNSLNLGNVGALAGPSATAKDSSISLYRPLTVIEDTQGDIAAMQKRADWEIRTRRGRASEAVISVQGWKHKDGLWRPNYIVPVKDDFLGIEGDMLISSVRLSKDSKRGSISHLSVVLPAAFDTIAVPATSIWSIG